MELTNEILQDHYADPYHCGECEQANFVAQRTDDGRDCKMLVALIVDEGTISEAWFEADGCEVCESLASMLMQRVEGQSAKSLDSLQTLELLRAANASDDSLVLSYSCRDLPIQTLSAALETNVNQLDDDLTGGTQFGGPSLREEC